MRDVTAREAFHTVLLREMVARLKQGAFVLKGGVNLRLFFGNVRYSQDIDFDLDPSARQPLSQLLRQLLADREFGLRLKELGIRGVHYGGRPHKDSTATLRFKLGIEIPGGIVLPTRIEASLRDRPEAEDVVVDTADERVVREYLRESDGPLLIPHYHWMPSIRQKIAALGLRRTVRARDVFDLHVLAHGRISEIDLGALRRSVPTQVLQAAHSRALEISYQEFADQVLTFLDEADRLEYENEDTWLRIQLFVAELLDSVMSTDREGEVL